MGEEDDEDKENAEGDEDFAEKCTIINESE